MLADGRRAVVTGEAGADDVGVSDTGDRNPAAGAVTVLAQRVGLDMGGVLAGGFGAVVAAGAIAGDVGVVEDRAAPVVGGMAVVTRVAAGDMIGRFTDRSGAVVAGEAGAGNTGVIKPGTTKAGCTVAVVAVATAGHVVGRFSSSGLTVMADTAGAGNITVFKSGYLLPVRRDMAIFAAVTGRYMVGGLAFTAQS